MGGSRGSNRVHPSAVVYPRPYASAPRCLARSWVRCLPPLPLLWCSPPPWRRPSRPWPRSPWPRSPWPRSPWPRRCPAPTLCRTSFSLRVPRSPSATSCLAILCTSACPALPPPNWLALLLATPSPLGSPLKVLCPSPYCRPALSIASHCRFRPGLHAIQFTKFPRIPHFSASLFCWRHGPGFCILTHQFRCWMYNSVHSQRREGERSKWRPEYCRRCARRSRKDHVGWCHGSTSWGIFPTQVWKCHSLLKLDILNHSLP